MRRPGLLVADQVFLAAHEERTGQLAVSGWELSAALAAGLLAELVLSGHLQPDPGYHGKRQLLLPTGATGVPVDATGHLLWEQIVYGPAEPVEYWLWHAAGHATAQVTDRLWRGGWLTHLPTATGTPGFASHNDLHTLRITLSWAYHDQHLPTPDSVVVAELIHLLDLDATIPAATTPTAHTVRVNAVDALGPGLRPLLDCARRALRDLRATHRPAVGRVGWQPHPVGRAS